MGRTQSIAPANQVSTNAYAAFAGSQIDTDNAGEVSIAFQLTETAGVNGVTFDVQGSIDGAVWTSLKTVDETGTERGSTDIAVAAGATAVAIIGPIGQAGAKSAFKSYRVRVKATIAASQGTGNVRGFAK
jgi:hypothetical protein